MKKAMDKKCYIKSMALISCQKPLCDDWFSEPITFDQAYVRAQEPDNKEFILPSEARRMSKILKRTICTAISSLNQAGIHNPNAIITGTGMGCMENSEKFLFDMTKFGEKCLKPTLFMQSTHNTIGSLIAIVLKCHGYNNTYSHKSISFESALLDAFVQMKLGYIKNALVGSHDEITPFTSLVLKHTHPEYKFLSETSMSSVISTDSEKGVCEIESVEILHKSTPDEIATYLNETKDSILLLGVNGAAVNDNPYKSMIEKLTFTPRLLQFKHIFGENFSCSAAGFYAAAKILERQIIPDFFLWGTCSSKMNNDVPKITMVNSSVDSTWSIIKLKRI